MMRFYHIQFPLTTISMKLEEATCENTCQYSLTGLVLRVKVLWTMKCNSAYAIFAVEMGDKIYKAYVWKPNIPPLKIGKIFYVKFGRSDPNFANGHYLYEVCDKDGNFHKPVSSEYTRQFEPEYNNMYDVNSIVYDSDDESM